MSFDLPCIAPKFAAMTTSPKVESAAPRCLNTTRRIPEILLGARVIRVRYTTRLSGQARTSG